jgi:hypothetical protein
LESYLEHVALENQLAAIVIKSLRKTKFKKLKEDINVFSFKELETNS